MNNKAAKILGILSLLLFFVMSAEAKNNRKTLHDSLVAYAKEYIGCRYQYGGKGPSKFDCSGYTGYVFKKFGYSLNASSSGQYQQGSKVKLKNTQIGDLIFFNGSQAGGSTVGHVGIICGVSEDGDTVSFIHASVQKGVTIDLYPGYDYYNKRFVGCKRVLPEISDVQPLPSDEEVIENNDSSEEVQKDTTPQPQKDEELKPEPSPKVDPHKKEKDHKKITPKPEPKKKKGRKELRKEEKRKKKGKDVEKKKPEPPQPQKEEKKPVGQDKLHEVKKGETLYRLSVTYGCTVEQLQKWNNLKDNTIKAGDVLIVGKP
jgi:LysM repeat protein